MIITFVDYMAVGPISVIIIAYNPLSCLYVIIKALPKMLDYLIDNNHILTYLIIYTYNYDYI
jgi:hypothetical protein